MKENTLRKLIPVPAYKKEKKLTSIQAMKEIFKKADERYMTTQQHAAYMFAKKLLGNKYSQNELEKMFL